MGGAVWRLCALGPVAPFLLLEESESVSEKEDENTYFIPCLSEHLRFDKRKKKDLTSDQHSEITPFSPSSN